MAEDNNSSTADDLKRKIEERLAKLRGESGNDKKEEPEEEHEKPVDEKKPEETIPVDDEITVGPEEGTLQQPDYEDAGKTETEEGGGEPDAEEPAADQEELSEVPGDDAVEDKIAEEDIPKTEEQDTIADEPEVKEEQTVTETSENILQTPPKPKKKSSLLYIIIIVVLFFGAAALGYLYYTNITELDDIRTKNKELKNENKSLSGKYEELSASHKKMEADYKKINKLLVDSIKTGQQEIVDYIGNIKKKAPKYRKYYLLHRDSVKALEGRLKIRQP